MKVQWKQPKGNGDYEVIHHETTADLVKYGNTTVEKTLNNLPGYSAFTQSILKAKDAAEVRNLLQLGVDEFYDETGARWAVTAAYRGTGQKKFGDTAGYFNGSAYLRRSAYLTLGGGDFTFAGWFYAPKTASSTQTFFGWGDSKNRIICARNSSQKFYTCEVVSSTTKFTAADMTNTVTMPTADWVHIEVDYDWGGDKLYFFANGQLVSSNTVSLPNEEAARQFYLGTNCNDTSLGFVGYIGEFLITKKCLHKANFTPPSVPYELDENTIALLHFQ